MFSDSRKVLWVDNEAESYLAPLGRILREAGIDLDIATTFDDAEKMLQERTYSSVLMDLIIPSRSGSLLSYLGVKLIENIRSGNYHKDSGGTQANVPIVILSIVLEEELKDLNCKYFNKLSLLEANMLSALTDALVES
jgi:DNA-binding response OmpR family regulator